MTDFLDGKPSTAFWIIGAAALVWNLIGLVFYYSHVTMTPEALAGFTQAQQDFFAATPTWATAAYATAVNAGVLGSLFLLLRKAWATPMFILSLLGIVVQDVNAFVMNNGIEVWGMEGVILPVIVIVIGVALLLYSRSARNKGWLA
ncbi:MAG: hypothetical protein OEM60_04165 [Gammaproteobacteria bacterium]|nr:hypothetical protein [Gammaproteobacteria bacterium]MDH3428499.1 hypothetical protein [Gammaproteobacteria bacterium]MDH3433023.1 hypothetical protein [Gammaproteobacteria bacterium]